MGENLVSAQDKLEEYMEELKKVELLNERESKRIREEETKHEQAEYDEIARMRHVKR